MSYTKTIVCLANSWKPPSGRCIAGREFQAGRVGSWVRPVSERETREVSDDERGYSDGTDPDVLDLISIVMKGPHPQNHQRENHLLDPTQYWQKQGRVSWQALQSAVDAPNGPLWINGMSTQHGWNDQVSESDAVNQTRSLYLVRPDNLLLEVAVEDSGAYGSKRRVRARFDLHGETYRLSVTDPPVRRAYLAEPDGQYQIPSALICVSLGEIFHGCAYKLAAAIITPERGGDAP